jgi:cullin 3
MMLFQKYVLKTPLSHESDLDVLGVLESVILDMIHMERSGEVIDRSLIRACVYVLEHLYESWNEDENSKLYITSLEPKFLETSRLFYDQEGRSLVANADASTFCTHATRRIQEEEERCQQTLSQSTESKIKAIVDKELIAKHIRDIINMEGTGVRHMLDNDRIEDLANVYDLSARVDPRKLALKEAVQKRVVDLGSDINKNALTTAVVPTANAADKTDSGKAVPERPINQQTAAAITWVEEILQLKAKYDRLSEQAFQKDPVMEKGLEISFQDFINANSRSSEYLSLFLDENLKKGVKGKTDAEVDFLLDKGIVLLQYISDKDLFETYYKKHLSKRLLMKKSASMDIERQMISKMKIKVGNTFTQRLESMFKDMNVSDDLNAQYKEYVSKLGDPDTRRIDIEASILTTTIWPFDNLFRSNDDGTPRQACVFPLVVENARKRFEKFYLDKHSGRALSWQANMGTADIRTTFRRANGKVQRHDLNVSTYAMVILLLFQDLPSSQCLTFEEIQAQTNIPAYELVRNLQSLALAPKTRVLRKDPMNKDVKPTDRFSFNEEFTSNFVKVKIGVVTGSSSKVENNEERRDTQKRTDEERGVAIEAAVVRIMK